MTQIVRENIYLALAIFTLSGCEPQTEYLDEGCQEGEKRCLVDHVEKCRSMDGNTYWFKDYTCEKTCNAEQTDCIPLTECPAGMDEEGNCRPDEYAMVMPENVIRIYEDKSREVKIRYQKNHEDVIDDNIRLKATLADLGCVIMESSEDGMTLKFSPMLDKRICATTLSIEDTKGKAQKISVPVQVLPSDANHNRIHDEYESELVIKKCRTHADCDTTPGAGDGFCDSFIGYQCSTKCRDDSYCVQSEKDVNLVCRGDGRCAPDAFVTVWKFEEAKTTLQLPLHAQAECNFIVDWGDGKKSEMITDCAKAKHDYDAGDYTVTIRGNIKGWGFKDGNWASYLQEVSSFGPVILGEYAFNNAISLKRLSSVDIPDSRMTSLKGAFMSVFHNAVVNDPMLSRWDTSSVTDMSGMFWNANDFNGDISHWDTSNVTNMSSMLSSASSFNGDISQWNTGNVTDMSSMFSGASSFNGDISQWDTAQVTNMSYMFFEATAFNGDISQWNTGNVTNMNDMFYRATKFDQDISGWCRNWSQPSVMGCFLNTRLSEENYCALQDSCFDLTAAGIGDYGKTQGYSCSSPSL